MGIQHAMRMRRIVICGPYGSAMFFPHYLMNDKDFEKKVIEYKMCVLIFSKTLSESFCILRQIGRDMVKNVYWSSCKVPAGFVRY